MAIPRVILLRWLSNEVEGYGSWGEDEMTIGELYDVILLEEWRGASTQCAVTDNYGEERRVLAGHFGAMAKEYR